MNKQTLLQKFICALLVMYGFLTSSQTLAVNLSDEEHARWTQHWNMLSRQIANSLIAEGRLDDHSVSIDHKPSALRSARYLEQQLQRTLIGIGIMTAPPNKADYVLELDMKMRKRSAGKLSAYAIGSDVDQFWVVQEVDSRHSYRPAYFEMTAPQNLTALADTDTEVIITVRIMQRGLIYLMQTFAFYFSSADLLYDEVVTDNNREVEFYSKQPQEFVEMDRKRDAKIEQLLNNYGY